MNKPTSESLKGAAACMKALRSAEKIASRPYSQDELSSMERHYEDYDETKAVFLNAAGPIPPHLRGFIEVMAEYVHFIMNTEEPDLYLWKPEAYMSVAEIEEARRKRTEEVMATMEEEASHV
jgi:hypothetical protein